MVPGFPGATLEQQRKILPNRDGNFNTLHDWLKANIYHGRKYTNWLRRVTGAPPLSIDPLSSALRQEMRELYALN